MKMQRCLILIILVSLTLCLAGLPGGEVKASPPDPTPTPATSIRDKLQPDQTVDVEPGEPDGRVLFEALPPAVERPLIETLAQQTFYAMADATVLQGYPSANLGSAADMWAGYDDYLNPDGQIVRSLVKFNISPLPANQYITQAALRVYLVNSWDFPGRSRTVTTYRITANWAEGSVTWNNKPGFGSAYGSRSIVHGAWGWYEFDATDLVRAWYGGTIPNYGLMLRGPEVSGSDSSWRGFGTKESPYPPQLIIEHVPAVAPQVNSITPNSGFNDGVASITDLAGANFQTGAAVKLTKTGAADRTATNVVVVNSAKITAVIDLTGAAAGAWNVVVANPSSLSGTLPAGFTVLPGEAEVHWLYLPLVTKDYVPPPPPPPPDPADLACLYAVNWWRDDTGSLKWSTYAPSCLMAISPTFNPDYGTQGQWIGYEASLTRQGKPNFDMDADYILNTSGGVEGASVIKTYEGGYQYHLEITQFCPKVGPLLGYRVKLDSGQVQTFGICP